MVFLTNFISTQLFLVTIVSLGLSWLDLFLVWPFLCPTFCWLDCFSALTGLLTFSARLSFLLWFSGVKAAVSRKCPEGKKRQKNVPEVEFERKNKNMHRIRGKEGFCLCRVGVCRLYDAAWARWVLGKTPPGLQMISGIVRRLIVSTCGPCSAT